MNVREPARLPHYSQTRKAKLQRGLLTIKQALIPNDHLTLGNKKLTCIRMPWIDNRIPFQLGDDGR
ncbi:MAG: hypothetical protein ACYC4S_16925, partial [Rhodoferax sp.]